VTTTFSASTFLIPLRRQRGSEVVCFALGLQVVGHDGFVRGALVAGALVVGTLVVG